VRLSILENKGQGLVLTRNVTGGEKIVAERPLISFRVPRSQGEAKQMLGAEWRDDWGQYGPQVFRDEVCRVLVKRAVASLSMEGQKQYRFLSDKENPKTDFGIFLTNAFPLDSYSFMGVFPILNRINHSCLPNSHHWWDTKEEEKVLFCSEDLEAGEELTISYMNLFTQDPDWQSRQSYLLKNFGFSCTCRLCSLEGAEREQDDKVRVEASTIVAQLKENGTSRELLDQLLNCFQKASFSPSIKAPVFLASATQYASENVELALDHLKESERLLRLCKDTRSPDFKQLQERKAAIMKQLQPN